MKATSQRLSSTLASLCLLVCVSAASDATHVDTARRYVGHVRESQGPNRSDIIDAWNRAVGAPLGSPYCASAVSAWCRAGSSAHRVRSAASRRHITSDAIDAARVVQGRYQVRRGDIIIWIRAGGGHIGVAAEDWSGTSGLVIEANTSSGQAGSQWDGDGVWIRRRSIQTYNAFRITHIIPCGVKSR